MMQPTFAPTLEMVVHLAQIWSRCAASARVAETSACASTWRTKAEAAISGIFPALYEGYAPATINDISPRRQIIQLRITADETLTDVNNRGHEKQPVPSLKGKGPQAVTGNVSSRSFCRRLDLHGFNHRGGR